MCPLTQCMVSASHMPCRSRRGPVTDEMGGPLLRMGLTRRCGLLGDRNLCCTWEPQLRRKPKRNPVDGCWHAFGGAMCGGRPRSVRIAWSPASPAPYRSHPMFLRLHRPVGCRRNVWTRPLVGHGPSRDTTPVGHETHARSEDMARRGTWPFMDTHAKLSWGATLTEHTSQGALVGHRPSHTSQRSPRGQTTVPLARALLRLKMLLAMRDPSSHRSNFNKNNEMIDAPLSLSTTKQRKD